MTITLDAKTEAALAARAAAAGTTPDLLLRQMIANALGSETGVAERSSQEELNQRLARWIADCAALDWPDPPLPVTDPVAKAIVEKFRRQGFSI